MNKPGKDLDEIKASLDNAEEMLASLNEEINTPVDVNYEDNFQNEPSMVKGDNSLNNGLWAGVSILILIFLGFTLSSMNKNTTLMTESDNQSPLVFARSCGSPASQTSKKWWPVLGPADPDLLREVKINYCGDAYITENNALQVASFTSWEGADAFAKRIERATNRRFRVGRGK